MWTRLIVHPFRPVAQYMMDDTIKTSEDVEKYLGWSTLALIPMMYSEEQQSNGKKAGKNRKTGSNGKLRNRVPSGSRR